MSNSTSGTESGSSDSKTTQNYTTKNSIYEAEAYTSGQRGTEQLQNQKTKLAGFMGLVTESFSTREFPNSLKNYIFGDFLKFNSPKNTNYSLEGATGQQATEIGIVEGAFFSDNHKRNLKDNNDLLELLKEAKKKSSLLKYLGKENINSLLIALSKSSEDDVEDLTLQQLKNELTKALNTPENTLTADTPADTQNYKIKDLYKLFNRFSGYIYSSKGDQQSPYVFTEKGENSEEKYYIGFVYQVNQFDFDEKGIKELKEKLSENTLNTLIVLLASNREIRD